MADGDWTIELGELDVKMGVCILEQSAERVVATMPVEGNRQSFGLLHGGASVAFAEALGSWAAVIHAPPGYYHYISYDDPSAWEEYYTDPDDKDNLFGANGVPDPGEPNRPLSSRTISAVRRSRLQVSQKGSVTDEITPIDPGAPSAKRYVADGSEPRESGASG